MPQIYRKNIRVYYSHTDAGGVLYHANYLSFMEQCRCDWLDELGHDVAQMQECDGIIWVVREAQLRYDAPARVFDDLTVTASVLQVGKVKLVMQQNIYNGDILLCHSVIKLATLDKTSFKLVAMPEALRLAFSQAI